MSNWGIGLLFGFGQGGRPTVLSIRDVEAHCPACGHEVVVRRYDADPFHSLTLARLRSMLDRGPSGFSGSCLQCEAQAGEADVVRWVLHYGFPSGAGLLQGFAEGTERRWLLSPHEAIDVQLVPAWDRSLDQSRREVDALVGDAVRAVFGREFNAKELARRELSTPAGPSPRVVSMGQGLVLVAASEELDEDALTRLAAGADTGEDWVVEPLVVRGVPTDGFVGAAAEWSPSSSFANAWGVAAAGEVRVALERIAATFPIQVGFEQRAGSELALVLPDPDEIGGQTPIIDAREVAREAARSMAHPGDIARLELDRVLLGLTGLWSPGDDDPSGP